ncbi:hypothetical protein HYV80_06155 [Candidatus Woesearchaeota archaeon]|nr:hypothetical protein [Candidatus Woesearchaeota archaeon]
MGKIRFFLIALAILPIMPQTALAHCPLCTVGAAFVAGGAAVFGVHRMVIGIFIGAFAASMGMWFGRAINKRFIPFQKTAVVLASYFLTVLPIWPLLKDAHPLLLNSAGDYGSLLNRTYLVDYFLIGSVIGSLIVVISPFLSEKITSVRKGRHIPFQGIALTFLMLIIIGVILQLMLHSGIIK